MLDENKVENCYRYLCARALVSETLIKEGCSHKYLYEKIGENYVQKAEAFINRVPSENEVIVYTTWAYADFLVPRHYDIIFDWYNVDDFVETPFILNYSLINISTYFMLVDEIAHGHKHACVLNFEEKIPEIITQLPDVSNIETRSKYICFCKKSDFEAIRENIKQQRREEY